MRFSVFTVSTPEWSPRQAATTLAQQGWEGIEWRITDQETSGPVGFWVNNRATWPLTGLEASLAEISSVTTGSGLEFAGIGSYAKADDHPAVERILAVTARLGAQRVRVSVPPFEPGRDYRDVFDGLRRDFVWVSQRAAEHGVKALVELHHRTPIASASSALRLLDGLDPDTVGVIHDLGNLLIEGQEDHLAAFQLLGPYLAHVHVKNALWRPVETGPDGSVRWDHEWAPLRTGQADVGAYLHDLQDHGYDGWVTSEDFSTELPLAERTADNLAYLKSFVVVKGEAGMKERQT
jgi:sugar phosphate isomerase/epimerase